MSSSQPPDSPYYAFFKILNHDDNLTRAYCYRQLYRVCQELGDPKPFRVTLGFYSVIAVFSRSTDVCRAADAVWANLCDKGIELAIGVASGKFSEKQQVYDGTQVLVSNGLNIASRLAHLAGNESRLLIEESVYEQVKKHRKSTNLFCKGPEFGVVKKTQLSYFSRKLPKTGQLKPENMPELPPEKCYTVVYDLVDYSSKEQHDMEMEVELLNQKVNDAIRHLQGREYWCLSGGDGGAIVMRAAQNAISSILRFVKSLDQKCMEMKLDLRISMALGELVIVDNKIPVGETIDKADLICSDGIVGINMAKDIWQHLTADDTLKTAYRSVLEKKDFVALHRIPHGSDRVPSRNQQLISLASLVAVLGMGGYLLFKDGDSQTGEAMSQRPEVAQMASFGRESDVRLLNSGAKTNSVPVATTETGVEWEEASAPIARVVSIPLPPPPDQIVLESIPALAGLSFHRVPHGDAEFYIGNMEISEAVHSKVMSSGNASYAENMSQLPYHPERPRMGSLSLFLNEVNRLLSESDEHADYQARLPTSEEWRKAYHLYGVREAPEFANLKSRSVMDVDSSSAIVKSMIGNVAEICSKSAVAPGYDYRFEDLEVLGGSYSDNRGGDFVEVSRELAPESDRKKWRTYGLRIVLENQIRKR